MKLAANKAAIFFAIRTTCDIILGGDILRLDKFLKMTRIIKRRVVAQELAKNKKIFRNNIALKPSSELKVGDVIEVFYKNRYLKIKVIGEKDYEIIEERKIEQEEEDI